MSNDDAKGTGCGGAAPGPTATDPGKMTIAEATREFNRGVAERDLERAFSTLVNSPLSTGVVLPRIERATRGGLTKDDLPDVFQDAACEFIAKLNDGFQPDEPLGLLIKMAQQRGIDQLRRRCRRGKARRSVRDGDDDEGDDEGNGTGASFLESIPGPSDWNPLTKLLKQELWDAAQEGIVGVSCTQERVAKAVLRDLRDENCKIYGLYPAVADETGKTRDAVKTAWRRTLKPIRTVLEQKGWGSADGREFEQDGRRPLGDVG